VNFFYIRVCMPASVKPYRQRKAAPRRQEVLRSTIGPPRGRPPYRSARRTARLQKMPARYAQAQGLALAGVAQAWSPGSRARPSRLLVFA
jgi:hypothetical protein